jgi:peptidoglycan hydrolase-like protein with peptidoglycan-binding domain
VVLNFVYLKEKIMSKVFGLYDTDEMIKPFQKMLNELLGLDLVVDGNIGKITQTAIGNYQASVKITETNQSGPAYGPLTQTAAAPFITKKYVQEADFVAAAAKANIELACLKAVTTVEAKQSGFLSNGFPIILFERHVFYKYLVKNRGQAFADNTSAVNPDICNSSTGGYLGGKAEIKRLQKASAIDAVGANWSTSFGLFQIMGFNFAQAGYASVTEYAAAMAISEAKQLNAFVSYLLNDTDGSLLKNLRIRNWAGFAREYNGPAYAQQSPSYDVRMSNAYNKLIIK